MRSKKTGTLAAMLAVALMAGSFMTGSISANGDKQSAKPADLAKADNDFGIDLFKRLHKDGENTFISPLSISTAMQMAGQAAAGDTRSEMDKAMGLEGINTRKANKALIAELNGREGVKLSMANSLWADTDRVTLNDEYVREIQDYFDSAVKVADFDDKATVDAINKWISDKTNGLIDKMLKEIPAEAIAYLINAIYFKGDWTVKFDKEKTKEADFHLADGTTKKVQLMSRKDDIVYSEQDGVQIAKLPYGKDKQSAMWVVLPGKDAGLDKLVADFDQAKFDTWRSRSWEREGTLRLPRFEMRYTKKLNETLKDAGIKQAFEMGKADFKRMGESPLGPIFINNVLHEAVVIVNEEGTEAAAATIIEMGAGGAAPPKAFNMTCDRPFLFLITDEPTGAILFMGACYQPEDPKQK